MELNEKVLNLPPFSLTRCFIQISLHKKQRVLPLLNKIKGGRAIALYAAYFGLLQRLLNSPSLVQTTLDPRDYHKNNKRTLE